MRSQEGPGPLRRAGDEWDQAAFQACAHCGRHGAFVRGSTRAASSRRRRACRCAGPLDDHPDRRRAGSSGDPPLEPHADEIVTGTAGETPRAELVLPKSRPPHMVRRVPHSRSRSSRGPAPCGAVRTFRASCRCSRAGRGGHTAEVAAVTAVGAAATRRRSLRTSTTPSARRFRRFLETEVVHHNARVGAGRASCPRALPGPTAAQGSGDDVPRARRRRCGSRTPVQPWASGGESRRRAVGGGRPRVVRGTNGICLPYFLEYLHQRPARARRRGSPPASSSPPFCDDRPEMEDLASMRRALARRGKRGYVLDGARTFSRTGSTPTRDPAAKTDPPSGTAGISSSSRGGGGLRSRAQPHRSACTRGHRGAVIQRRPRAAENRIGARGQGFGYMVATRGRSGLFARHRALAAVMGAWRGPSSTSAGGGVGHRIARFRTRASRSRTCARSSRSGRRSSTAASSRLNDGDLAPEAMPRGKLWCPSSRRGARPAPAASSADRLLTGTRSPVA